MATRLGLDLHIVIYRTLDKACDLIRSLGTSDGGGLDTDVEIVTIDPRDLVEGRVGVRDTSGSAITDVVEARRQAARVVAHGGGMMWTSVTTRYGYLISDIRYQ